MSAVDGPEPGTTLSSGAEAAEPRAAASLVLLRGGEERLELLLVKRTERARFMAGVWVFPGGAVDAADGTGDAAHRAAAVRELAEEAGVLGVAGDELVAFSRWITPRQVSVRFDTFFFLATMPAGQEVHVDGQECVDSGWFTPQDALDAHGRGELLLVFPTIKHLEQFAGFASAAALLAHARGRVVEPVEPRVVTEGEVARVLLPGEPGYDGG